MTPEQMRQAMPMTRYWAIKRGIKNGTAAFFQPITSMFELVAESLKVMADQLQDKFIHKKEK